MRTPSGRGVRVPTARIFHVSDRSKVTLGDASAWLTLGPQEHISIPIGLPTLRVLVAQLLPKSRFIELIGMSQRKRKEIRKQLRGR